MKIIDQLRALLGLSPKKPEPLVIGIIPNSSTTETLLNNLSEADYKLQDVSVILGDLKARDAIAKDTAGPFKGITADTLAGKLAQLGLPAADSQPYVDAVKKGKAFVALLAPQGSEQAAAEMFKDASGELIRIVTPHEQKSKPPMAAV